MLIRQIFPIFGVLTDDPSLLAASGLGSSGLTTGPYIGYLLANFLNTGHWPTEDYQKDISTYITKIHHRKTAFSSKDPERYCAWITS